MAMKTLTITLCVAVCGLIHAVVALKTTTTNSPSSYYRMKIDIRNAKLFNSPPISSDFASLSYEVPCPPSLFAEKPWQGWTSKPSSSSHRGPWEPRKSFANLMSILHSGGGRGAEGRKGPNIRIGGNSADLMWYEPLVNETIPPSSGGGDTLRISPRDVLTYNFASQWNGSLSIGFNIRLENNTENSMEYVSATQQLVASSLIAAYEVGNEVDIFVGQGIRSKSSGWDFEQYNAEFARYVAAMQETAGVKMPLVQGATFCCIWQNDLDGYMKQWTNKTVGEQGQNQDILVTNSQHHYPLNPKDASIPLLLARETATSILQYAPQAAFAQTRGIDFVVGEANSVNLGGKAGVSNAFAAALWAIDTMMFSASNNFTRWNFHGCPTSPTYPCGDYTAIDLKYNNINTTSSSSSQEEEETHAVACPLFYGLWFFSEFTYGNPRVIESSSSSSPTYVSGIPQNLSIWTVASDHIGGDLSTAILQKSLPSSVGDSSSSSSTTQLSLEYGVEFANRIAKVKALEASSLAEEWNITFKGQTLNGSLDGIPIGQEKWTSVQCDANGTLTLQISQSSALLVEFRES